MSKQLQQARELIDDRVGDLKRAIQLYADAVRDKWRKEGWADTPTPGWKDLGRFG